MGYSTEDLWRRMPGWFTSGAAELTAPPETAEVTQETPFVAGGAVGGIASAKIGGFMIGSG